MRWFLIDRFTEFVCGQYAVAVRGISLSEEAVDEYTPGWPTYPTSLIVEGMAQTGGILVSQATDFRDRVVLAKVSRLVVESSPAQPGDVLQLRAELHAQTESGAVVHGVVTRDDQPFASIDLMFAKLDDQRFQDVELFEPADFCGMLRCLKLFDVGVYPDGTRLAPPPHMIEAEQAQLKTRYPTRPFPTDVG